MSVDGSDGGSDMMMIEPIIKVVGMMLLKMALIKG